MSFELSGNDTSWIWPPFRRNGKAKERGVTDHAHQPREQVLGELRRVLESIPGASTLELDLDDRGMATISGTLRSRYLIQVTVQKALSVRAIRSVLSEMQAMT